MLGIVRTQPPTGSPYMEPGVVRRMAKQRPTCCTRGVGPGAGLGMHYIQPPLPGSRFPAGQEPWVVAAMARNLPPRFNNFTDIPSYPLADGEGAVIGIGVAGILLTLGLAAGTIALGVYAVKRLTR